VTTDLAERHYHKCQVCAEPVAIEGPRLSALPACSYCGGQLRYMGQVDGNRFARTEERTACDERCTQAVGPDCNCRCMGANHGTGRVVTVVVESGIARITTPNDPKTAARVEKALAIQTEFEAQCSEAAVKLVSISGEVSAAKRNGEYLRGERYRLYSESTYLLDALRRIAELHTPKGRLDALKRILPQIDALASAEVVPEVSVELESPTAPVAPAPEPVADPLAGLTQIPGKKLMAAQYAGICPDCKVAILVGQPIYYDRQARRAVHAECPSGDKIRTPQVTVSVPTDPSAFVPTDEQRHCLDLFAKGGNLAIKAGAGTGKTRTLRYIAESYPTLSFQYVAFNAAIVRDTAGKMPSNVAVRTMHSLAWEAMRPTFGHRKDARKPSRMSIAHMLGIDSPMYFRVDNDTVTIAPYKLVGIVLKAIERFCNTADEFPGREHVPYVKGIDTMPNGKPDWTNNRELARTLEPAIRRAWADQSSPTGVLPFSHPHYLKLWELSEPRIPIDVILADESQDLYPVLVSIVEQQSHARRVFVGDDNQTIYGYLGCVNALDTVQADNVAYLTKSFRFGSDIADVANKILGCLPTEMVLTGAGPQGTVGPIEQPRAILTRTNAGAIEVFLARLERGEKPHLAGPAKEIITFAKACIDLKTKGQTEHPDLMWATCWLDVQRFVEDDAQGADLKLMVKIMDDFGPETIIQALESMPPENKASVVISTSHKVKGKEFESVRLYGDFPAEPDGDEAYRLLYVATTRAQRHLDITACKALVELMKPSEPEIEPVRQLAEVEDRRLERIPIR